MKRSVITFEFCRSKFWIIAPCAASFLFSLTVPSQQGNRVFCAEHLHQLFPSPAFHLTTMWQSPSIHAMTIWQNFQSLGCPDWSWVAWRQWHHQQRQASPQPFPMSCCWGDLKPKHQCCVINMIVPTQPLCVCVCVCVWILCSFFFFTSSTLFIFCTVL